MIVSDVRSYILHTFTNTKAKKPWFNSACSHANKDREVGHKRYRSHPSAETHALCISARNHTKSIIQLTLSSIENVKIFQILTLLAISGIWPIISPTILLLHHSFLYFNQLAPQLSQLTLKLNSPLKPLLPTLLWMILEIFLLLLHPLTTSFLKLKLIQLMFFMPSLALIFGRFTV